MAEERKPTRSGNDRSEHYEDDQQSASQMRTLSRMLSDPLKSSTKKSEQLLDVTNATIS